MNKLGNMVHCQKNLEKIFIMFVDVNKGLLQIFLTVRVISMVPGYCRIDLTSSLRVTGQTELNDLPRTRLSRRRMTWLLPPPPPSRQ
jgi:hypothetical protein